VTLSMVAAKRMSSRDRTLDENTVIPIDKDLSLLTSAAVYGANASGKSNLADAMNFMKRFVIDSAKDTQTGEYIPIEQFALNPAMREQPTLFEIVLIAEGTQYRYGFELDNERVIHEWLYHVLKHKEELLFERNGGNFSLSRNFKEGRDLEGKTRENALFLSVVAQFNGEIASHITRWFLYFDVISGIKDATHRILTELFLRKESMCKEIQKFVSSLDFGIDDIFMEGDKIKTRHRAYTDAGEFSPAVTFDLETQESEGTKKLLAIAGNIIANPLLGVPLIIDEFDARLHPNLTREIVRLFNNKETNPKHAQLIFMTHDTNLLDKTLLRRDQIWFVEKDRVGASHLYSLAELKVRNDASFEKDYVQGRYGAIPFLGGLARVLEGQDDQS